MIVEHGKAYNFVFQLPPQHGDTAKPTVTYVHHILSWHWLLERRRLLAMTLESGIREQHRHESLCLALEVELKRKAAQSCVPGHAKYLIHR